MYYANQNRDRSVTLAVSEVEFLHMYQGLQMVLKDHYQSVAKHLMNCTPTMCMMYEVPKEGRDCSEDAEYLTTEIIRLEAMIQELSKFL